MKKQPKQTETNIKRQFTTARERFEIISNYHLLDARLTLAEKGFLTCLLILPNKWRITQRATANYLHIDKMTFNKYVKKLLELGYIELKKNSKTEIDYIIKDKPTKADFDIRYINDYTIKQLNQFLNDTRIEQRYKELIKKALGTATETSENFNKLVAEIEQDQEQADIPESEKLPF